VTTASRVSEKEAAAITNSVQSLGESERPLGETTTSTHHSPFYRRIKPNRNGSVSPPTITTVSSRSHDWLNEDLEQHLQQDGTGITEHVYQRNRSYNIDPSVVVAPTTPKQDSTLGIPLPTTSSIRESGGGGIVSDMIAQQRSETSTSAGPHVSFAATFPERRTSDAEERSYSDEDDAHGRGTLTIGEDGRARYIGPTGGSEWLQEVSVATG